MESFNPSNTCYEDQEEQALQFRQQCEMKKNFIPRERKVKQFIRRPETCFLQGTTKTYLPKQLRQQMDFNETSSSSSSSSSSSESSSDSENELNTVMKPRTRCGKNLWHTKQQMQPIPREWFTVVDLEGFRPEEVTAKLNPKCRILVIKVKKTNNIRQQQQMELPTFGKKLVRIIPLPENIHLEQLRVKVTGRNELVVKAPFIPREELMQQKQYQRGLPCTWIPLEVTIKRNTIFGTQQQQPIKRQQRNWFTTDNTNVNLNINKRHQISEQMHDNFHVTSFIGYPLNQEVRGQEWSKARKNMARGVFQHTSTHNSSIPLLPEYIRDEETGKVALLIKVNVVGFRPEDVRVRVDETERLLIVEATKRSADTSDMTVQHQQEEAGLTVKYLRREFVLPQFLDMSHIAFRVLKTGVLAIKLPIVKHMKKMTQKSDEEDVQEQDLLNFNKWEKPTRA